MLLLYIIIELTFVFTIWGINKRIVMDSTIAQLSPPAFLAQRQQKNIKFPEMKQSLDEIKIAKIIEQIGNDDFTIPKQLIGVDKGPIQTPEQDIFVIKSEADIDIETGSRTVLFSRLALNDLMHINNHFSAIFNSLADGGFVIFRYIPLEIRYQEVKARRLDFLLHRVLPRLPILEWLYFIVTKGRNRALSRAEVWGRLQYNGFDVKKEEVGDGCSYILARKQFEPSKDANPSHYPIIKLDRVGLGGEIIKIHKVRTMHPYSEFIQQKVFDMHDLSSTGKFKEDFRITSWGKILRRCWLDELPQILDWLQGNVKIVGIRAMSLHYFSLYPKRYQDKYYRVKPGFLSPIFDENTSSFYDIVTTEEKYLDAYIKHPLMTDLKYFKNIINEILFKGTRSA